jgi:hypothetical protein
MSSSIVSPFPFFTDTTGAPLEGGYIYIGQSNLNPETAPVNVFWDAALTIPAAQPVRTVGGYPSRQGTPSRFYSATDTYSITVRNKNRALVFSAFDQSDAPTSVFDISTQLITATAGQTTFTLTVFSYLPGTDTLQVFRNGLRLNLGLDYLETNSSTVTLTAPAALGDQFLFQGGAVVTGDQVPGSGVSFIQAGTGAVTRNMQDKARESVSVLDFGAVGDGVTDDTVAVQAAIDSLGALGGAVLVPGNARIYLASSITVKPNVRLFGEIDHGIADYTTQNYYSFGSQLLLNTGATINLQRNAALERLLIIRKNLYSTVPTNATQAQAVVAAFSGTAVQIGSGVQGVGDDASVVSCMILGHTNGIVATNSNRVTVGSTLIDCTNGFSIDTSFDINRIYSVHCWPFLTAQVPGVGNTPDNPAPNRRSGYGFKLTNYCDWSTLIDCFAYGYATGFWASSASNISFVRCQADYTNPNTGSVCGFKIDGTSTYCSLGDCTSIAGVNGLIADTTGGAASDSAIRVNGCLFANTAECILVSNGNITCVGNTFNSGLYAASFQAGADASSIVGCILDGVNQDFAFSSDTTKFQTSIIANTYNTVTVSAGIPERIVNNNFTVQNTAAKFEVFDRRTIAGGVGPEVFGSQLFAAGKQDSFKLAANLVSATAGNEAVTLDFYVNRNGSLVKRMALKYDGTLNLPNLPTSSAGLVSGDLWINGTAINIVP